MIYQKGINIEKKGTGFIIASVIWQELNMGYLMAHGVLR